MNIAIKENKSMIITQLGQTQNENLVTEMDIQLPEKYKDYIKTICFMFPDGEEGYEVIGTEEKYYIKNSVSQYPQVDFYIMLNSGDEDFRTETKTIKFFDNKNVVGELTPVELDDFHSVLKILEEEITKVKQLEVDIDKIDLDVTKQDKVTTLTIMRKDGVIKEVEIRDGKDGINGNDGDDGKDALINGENVLEIIKGKNIDLQQKGSTLQIHNTYEYDDTHLENNIEALQMIMSEHDRDIINVENEITALSEELQEQEETLNHLDDIKQDKLIAGNNITINGNVISSENTGTIDYNDLINKPKIPLKTSDLENDEGYIDINSVPTAVSQLNNDLDYKTETEVNTLINNAIKGISGIEFEIVDELPSVGEKGKFYLISNGGKTPNIYDEYIYVNNSFEKIGTTEVNLSNYVNLNDVQTITGKKTFSAEVTFTQGGQSDICSGIACAFKVNRSQITNLITQNIYAPKGGLKDIVFYKFFGTSGMAPSELEQIAKIDMDGNLYESSTKLSDKYASKSNLDAGLATRLATDLENIDQAGVQKIIEIVQQNIPNAEGVEF